jgi:prefoldin subunit 5
MEINLLQRRKVLEEKIPEIEKTIAVVDLLTEKKETQEPLYTDFELNDTLYAKAKIEASDSVYLWLGVSINIKRQKMKKEQYSY